MTTNKIFITATPNHRLYSECQKLPGFLEIHEMASLESTDTVFDFSLLPKDEKKALLKKTSANVFSDLSIYNSHDFFELKNLKGVFSTAFYSPTKAFEYKVLDSSFEQIFLNLFPFTDFKPISISESGIGFIFPRILVQIINEAYFAMAEEVASGKDIDTACLYGVSYPLGPIEWAKRSNPQNVKNLLLELLNTTGEARYRPASNLL